METMTTTPKKRNRKKRGKGKMTGALVQDITPVTFTSAPGGTGDEKTKPEPISLTQTTARNPAVPTVSGEPEKLLPEGIAYLRRRATRGAPLSPEDLYDLQTVAKSYGCTPREFLVLLAQNQGEFDKLLSHASASIATASTERIKEARRDISEAIDLTLRYPFLGTAENIGKLDGVALSAELPWMRLRDWRRSMKKMHNSKFVHVSGISDYANHTNRQAPFLLSEKQPARE
jgi:hypothetical protein